MLFLVLPGLRQAAAMNSESRSRNWSLELYHLWAEWTGGHMSDELFAVKAGRIIGDECSPLSETQASMEPLSRSEAMSRLVEYPNLQAMMQGCVSGQSTEWPLLRAELCRLLAIQDAGPNDALAGKLPTERAFTILRWCVEHDGECLGDHKDLIALARETLNAARR